MLGPSGIQPRGRRLGIRAFGTNCYGVLQVQCAIGVEKGARTLSSTQSGLVVGTKLGTVLSLGQHYVFEGRGNKIDRGASSHSN